MGIGPGTICGLTSVIMMDMPGKSRIIFAMGRDRLLPTWFSKVHPRFGTPYRVSIVTGILITLIAAFTPLDAVAEFVSIGTLMAFVLVAIGIVVLRYTRPAMACPFKAPLVPVLPIIVALISVYLMLNLPTFDYTGALCGVAVYFLYGAHHCLIGARERES